MDQYKNTIYFQIKYVDIGTGGGRILLVRKNIDYQKTLLFSMHVWLEKLLLYN
jgi:hypothetical protein